VNPCWKRLRKIEFVVTTSCTGHCKHCSQGEHGAGVRIDPLAAADAVERIAAEYSIQTVMAFGGEPLMHPEAVTAIMKAARKKGIAQRQLITNGFFSQREDRIRDMALLLSECGVNDLLLSVDAFHQETIPLEPVCCFARALRERGVPLRLQPAWLGSPEDENPYNEKTRKILNSFGGEYAVSGGNVIFPEGNALLYLKEYFIHSRPANPYVEDPRNPSCLSFSADGTVLGRSFYQQDVMEILRNYAP